MKRKPTALKKIDGTFRKDRERNEPKPAPVESLEPPTPLDTQAREFWDYYAPKLSKLNLLTELDSHTLALAAQWWSIHTRAMAELKDDLVHLSDANGECCRPELTAAKAALSNLQTLMARFGMDPLSRAKISVPPPEKKDEIGDRYFNRPRAVS